MSANVWESDWFPRALSGFLTHDDALRLAIFALQKRLSLLSRVLVYLHGPLAPISTRNLVVCAASVGDWDAVVVLQRHCRSMSQRHRKRRKFKKLTDQVAVMEAAGGVVMPTLYAAMRLERWHPVQLPGSVLYNAAKCGQLAEVIWLVDIVVFDIQIAIEAAAGGNHGRVVQWLLDHITLDDNKDEDLLVAKPQRVQCDLRLDDPALAEVGIITWREEPRNIAYAFIQGYGLLPPHRERRMVRGYPLMNWAAWQGNVALLERLATHSGARTWLSSDCPVIAASQGHQHVLEWLVRYDRDLVASCATRIMAEAARRGDVIEWMRQSDLGYVVGSLTAVFDAACAGGHLATVRWAFENYLDERVRPRYVLMKAAGAGHLDIVKYLYEEQGYSIMGSTVAQAVAHGHLDVAQWLYRRWGGSLGLGDKAMLVPMAVKSGNLAVLKWLVEELGLWSDQAIDNAAWVGGNERVAVLDYLWGLDPAQLGESLSRVSIMRLIRGDKKDVAEWILRHVSEPTAIAIADIVWFSAFLRKGHVDERSAARKRLSSVTPTIIQSDVTKIVDLMLRYRPRFCREINCLPLWAIRRGSLGVLKQLEVIGHPHLLVDRVLKELLLYTRSTDMMLWFLQKKSLSVRQSLRVIRWAAQYCALPVLQYIIDTTPPTQCPKYVCLRGAAWVGARHGHLEVLQFVRMHASSQAVEELCNIWNEIQQPGANILISN